LIRFYFEKSFTRQTEITIEKVVDQINPELLKHTLAGDTADRKEQWQNIFDSILKIKRYCNNNGIKFFLAIYPWGHQVSDKEWIPGRFLAIPKGALVSDKSIDIIHQFSIDNNIELLNLFSAFRLYKGPSPLYFSYDMHFTPTGHKIMARELDRYIRATYFKGMMKMRLREDDG
jgi:hypothetical protein